MPRKRKTRSDSVAGQVKAKRDESTIVAVPEGVELRSDEDRILWRQFTHARSADSWREFDLILIAKMVAIEADIRKHNKMIEETSVVVQNRRGTMVENPLLRVVDTLTRQMLSLVRSLSLGVHSDTARDANSSGSKAEAKAVKDGKVLSLLAR